MIDLVRRQEATRQTMAKYRKKAWSWERGVTCVHMARFHLRKMGHKTPPMPRIKSLTAAKRALKSHGWSNCMDLLEGQRGLVPIAPAHMLLGDVAVTKSADGLGAILVCAGNYKMLGWHDDAEGMVVIDVSPDELDGAFRV